MAAAAEKFRLEMDAMRDRERQKAQEISGATDMDAFDKKLEDAAAAGQFEDSDEEDLWDMPTESEASKPTNEAPLLFQQSFAEPQAPADSKPLTLDQPAFGLSSLMDAPFGLKPVVVEVQDEWYYLDPQGMQQGPFKTAEMREWFEAGYFKPHLPIRFGREGTFTALANHFLQGQMPFAAPPQPSPKMSMGVDIRLNEQQRLMELHQQRQQQQMLQLQQQQQQQRMMQFNQEEKIRLEMQRLELARQQQNHLFHQQQIMHQQQQQHQHLQQQQQQQMFLQQQDSWQQSQREGIMSALGMFGGNDAKSVLPAQPSHQFESDLRVGQHAVQGQPSHDAAVRLSDPWGATQRSTQETRDVLTSQGASLVPDQSSSAGLLDPWGKVTSQINSFAVETGTQSKVVSDVVSHEKQLEGQTAQQSVEDAIPSTPKETPTPPAKEKAKVSPPKKQARSNDEKRDSRWGAAPVQATSAKSLKDIQEEEQRQLRKSLEEQSSDSDLAKMGAQLKMMLGVSAGANAQAAPAQSASPAKAPQTAAPRPSAPATNAWGVPARPTQASTTGKSMREILAEEERLASERAKRSENQATSSHWMNVVAGNTAAPKALSPRACPNVSIEEQHSSEPCVCDRGSCCGDENGFDPKQG
ncbi:hypothetical protein PINS_up015520 [Pythium insidiosum]|nr:hypothetical protein PINS_up015520 [Pythium insidiosum]